MTVNRPPVKVIANTWRAKCGRSGRFASGHPKDRCLAGRATQDGSKPAEPFKHPPLRSAA